MQVEMLNRVDFQSIFCYLYLSQLIYEQIHCFLCVFVLNFYEIGPAIWRLVYTRGLMNEHASAKV